MEIKSKILHGLSLRFHEDDTYAYESPAWKERLKFEKSDKRLNVIPIPTKSRDRKETYAHSASGVLQTDQDTRVNRLFTEVKLSAARVGNPLQV